MMDYKETSPIDREEKAKALLKEAGFGPGKPLKVEIRYNTTDNNRNTVIAIAEQWKQIGIETSFINTDGKTHFAHLRDGGDFDVARYGWIADYSDPNNFLFLLKSDNKGFNYGKYNNPQFDKLLDSAAAELDLKKRADQMKQAGIETSFINTDGKTHFAHLRDGGDFDVARYGWIADVNDPSNFLFLLKSDNKGFNAGKYNNPQFDKLLDQAATELDLKKRADIMRQAEAIAMKDMPWIPIMYYGKSNLISPKIQGFVQNTRGVYPSRFLSKTQ
jgi:ABC-type oligopeptide transport system substrate-binding subunit